MFDLQSAATNSLLELAEARAMRREQDLATELDGQRGRHPRGGSHQRGLDRLIEVQLLLGVMLQSSGERAEETVGRQDAQKVPATLSPPFRRSERWWPRPEWTS